MFDHLRARAAPGVFAFHPANGGYRKPIEAAIMKGMGVVAGVPDIIAVHRGCVYALEIKTEKGRISTSQAATIKAMRAAGAICTVAFGLDAALYALQSWGILRGQAA